MDQGGFMCGACMCFVVVPSVILILLSFATLEPIEYGLNFNAITARSCTPTTWLLIAGACSASLLGR